jgi:hypothetical protein
MTAVAGKTNEDGVESEELDLTRPGKLWCKAKFERDTTFHLVLPQKGYTKNQLTLNPQLNPADQLMKPFTVPTKDQDQVGKTYCDLDTTGRALEIMNLLNDRTARGEPTPSTVRAVYISTARNTTERDPQVAEVKDLKLLPVPTVNLIGTGDKDPLRTYITVPNFKDGLKEFTVEMWLTGPIREVEISVAPAAQITLSTGETGKGTLKARLEEAKRYKIKVAAPFTMRMEQNTINYPFQWYGYDCWYRTAWSELQEREVWTGGSLVLRVAGTAQYAKLARTVELRAEAWASGWMSRTPPPPLRHNHC